MIATATAMRAVRATYLEVVKRYHRLDISIEAPIPDTPCLIVANHGFGRIFDLNIDATLAAPSRPSRVGRPIQGSRPATKIGNSSVIQFQN